MKKLIPFICLAALVLTLGASRRRGELMPKNLASAPAPTYLINERFEATGYDQPTWFETGSANEDFSNSGLSMEGSQCLMLDATSSSAEIRKAIGSTPTTAFVYVQFRTSWLPPVISDVTWINNDFDSLSKVRVLSDGRIGIGVSGGSTVYTTDAITTNITYHIFHRYTTGSGANGTATVGFSTDGTEPTSGNKFASSTDGTSLLSPNYLVLNNIRDGGQGGTNWYDKVLLSAGTIGSNPL